MFEWIFAVTGEMDERPSHRERRILWCCAAPCNSRNAASEEHRRRRMNAEGGIDDPAALRVKGKLGTNPSFTGAADWL